MNDPKFVSVFDATDNLFEDFASFFFSHSLFINDIVKKFSVFHVLHNKEEMFRGFNDLEKLNDVWVSNQLENMDFS